MNDLIIDSTKDYINHKYLNLKAETKQISKI